MCPPEPPCTPRPVGRAGGGLRLRHVVAASAVEVFAEDGGAHLTRLALWPLGTGKG
ncbi:hypothetical protein [Streptomyces nigrescens]